MQRHRTTKHDFCIEIYTNFKLIIFSNKWRWNHCKLTETRSPSPSPFTPAMQASGEATFKHVTFPRWTSQRCIKTQNSWAPLLFDALVRKLASVKFVYKKKWKERCNKQNCRPAKLVTDSYPIYSINRLPQLRCTLLSAANESKYFKEHDPRKRAAFIHNNATLN